MSKRKNKLRIFKKNIFYISSLKKIICVKNHRPIKIIYTFSNVREEIGNFNAALAVFFEMALTAEQSGIARYELVFGIAERGRPGLAV